jgi:pimeloyl-ACP methyl ester carboxylesterase
VQPLSIEDFGGASDRERVRVAIAPGSSLAPRPGAKQRVHCAATVGGLLSLRLRDHFTQRYFVYVPRRGYRADQLFVTVHGISRNAREHARRFAPYAERHGTVLVAPLFDEQRFPNYQQLGRAGRGERADWMLERIVQDTRALLGCSFTRYWLFGFSGGAQFVHRFALAHPCRVAAYAVAAAGWYTFPDPAVRYPRGLRPIATLPDLSFQLERFLDVPGLVVVGDRDRNRDSGLRRGAKLESQQGRDRVARAANWVGAMRATAIRHGKASAIELHTLPRCGHSFRRCMQSGDMGERVFEWFHEHGRGRES